MPAVGRRRGKSPRARSAARGRRSRDPQGQFRPAGAGAAAGARVRAGAARHPHAHHGRVRTRRAHARHRAVQAHPHHFHHGAESQRTAAHVPRLRIRRRRRIVQADQHGDPPAEGGGVLRTAPPARRASPGRAVPRGRARHRLARHAHAAVGGPHHDVDVAEPEIQAHARTGARAARKDPPQRRSHEPHDRRPHGHGSPAQRQVVDQPQAHGGE